MTAATAESSAAGEGEFRRGWTLVMAATIGVGLGLSPIPFYEIGLMAPELAREFHWPIATIMGGVFFMMLGVLIMAPLVGWLTDRYGVRPVTMTSLVCFSLSLALFAVQTGSIALYLGTWLLMALAGTGTLPITWTRTVNQSFEVHKGLALGITLTGTGLSGFLLKPAVASAIAAYGWRGGFLLLAALPVLIALPLAWLFFHPAPAPNAAGESAPVAAGIPLRSALRDWRFWVIGGGILPIAFAISGPIPNMEMILSTRGVSRDVILGAVPFLGLAIIAGRLGGGWLVDRFWAPGVALCLLSLSALSVWSLAHGSTAPVWITLNIIGVGIAAGVEFDLLAFLIARYFGMAFYSSIYGLIYVFFALGSGIAPYVFGRAFDSARSFAGVLTLSAALILCGALIFLSLGRYRYPARR
jgi:predicted MFS family arabinose efflux permease